MKFKALHPKPTMQPFLPHKRHVSNLLCQHSKGVHLAFRACERLFLILVFPVVKPFCQFILTDIDLLPDGFAIPVGDDIQLCRADRKA
jgi:hypothetical protein